MKARLHRPWPVRMALGGVLREFHTDARCIRDDKEPVLEQIRDEFKRVIVFFRSLHDELEYSRRRKAAGARLPPDEEMCTCWSDAFSSLLADQVMGSRLEP